MLRCMLLIIGLFSLAACTPENESYYRKNPQALQLAIQNCPEKSPLQINCDRLVLLARRTNELAYQLQLNPQAFGNKILKLQADLAEQHLKLIEDPEQRNLKNKFRLTQEDLMDHFAIVKWLESPKK